MIKITGATHVRGKVVSLEFSDGTQGSFDFSELLSKQTSLTIPLQADEEFQRFFLELGALCWPNGLEFSGGSLHQRIDQAGGLSRSDVA
jgi:hypothetical protein